MLDYAIMDNGLAQSQRAIGESSNLAQLALTYTYNFTEQKYRDYVCILSVIAQAAIDNAKRKYDINIVEEIKRIKLDMDIKNKGYPLFWTIINYDFNKNRINNKLTCPMNSLVSIKLQKYRSNMPTLPMEKFFKSFPLEESRKKCKKVEDLINKYRLNLLNEKDDQEAYILLREDFDKMIEDIKKIYLSQSYLGLTSWLIDRAFCISNYAKMCANRNYNQTSSNLGKNKALLLKVLYRISPKSVLKVFENEVKLANGKKV